MTHHLVVTKPFLSFVRGDIIADASKVSDILSTEYNKFVTKFALPTTSKG
jgi:hypothetical protein